MLYKQSKKNRDIEVFTASMRDIEKALRLKTHSDPRMKLPENYHQFLDVFDHSKADTLPPLRGDGIDHSIELVCGADDKEPTVPWGPFTSPLEMSS